MKTGFSAWVFLCLAVQSGCSPTSDFPPFTSCDVVVDDSLKISASEEAFRPLDDGADVEVTLGFQGGYHVYAALQLPVQPTNPVKLSLNLCQGTQIVARNRIESEFRRNDETFMSDRHLIYVLHDYRAEQLADVPSRLAVRVQDADGQTWETAVDVVTRCCQGVQ